MVKKAAKKMDAKPAAKRPQGRPPHRIIGEKESAQIVQWMRENQSLAWMASQLGVVYQSVQQHILKKIKPTWKNLLHVAIDQEADRIANIEATAWRQFWESCKPEEREKIKEQMPDISGDMTVEQILALTTQVTERELTRIGQSGNPAYLRQVFECIEWRCRMAGIVPPDRHEHTIYEDRAAGLTPEQEMSAVLLEIQVWVEKRKKSKEPVT